VTNVAPLLFHLAAINSGRPKLELGPPEGISEEYRPDELVEQIEPLLRPAPLSELLQAQRAGVPRLTRSEVEALLSGARRTPRARPSEPRWELLPLTDETSCLFPMDEEPRPNVRVLLPVQVGTDAYQLRRFDTALNLRPSGPTLERAPTIVPERCVLRAERDDPNLPYHGVCESTACNTRCTPLVQARTRPGAYILTGCRCGG
jgi:hypothetical protein